MTPRVLFVPWFANATTLHPRLVLMSRRLRGDLQRQAEVLAHEVVHVEQMRRDGWLRFVVRYVFSHAATGHWCARYEMEAYAVNVERWHRQGWPYDQAIERIATHFRQSRAYYICGAPALVQLTHWLANAVQVRLLRGEA